MPAPVTAATLRANPRLQNFQRRFQDTVSIAAERAAAHLDDPKKYPLPGGGQSLEKALHGFFAALPLLKRRKLLDELEPRFKATAAQRRQRYGDLGAVSLTAAKSITDQVVALPVPDALRITKADADAMQLFTRQRAASDKKTVRSTKAKPRLPAIGANANLLFFIESITCDKTSEVRRDEISLAGLGTGDLNQPQNTAPFFVKKFKKGETVTLNQQLYSFVLDNSTTVPLNFTAGLFLVEKDLLSAELTDKLLVLFGVLSAVCGVLGMAMLIAGLAGAAFVTVPMMLVTLGVGLLLALIGIHVIARLGDDTSNTASDTLTLEAPFNIGDVFERTLSFSLSNTTNGDVFPGNYTAKVRWEVVA